MDSGSLNRPGMVPDQEKIYQKYEAIKEEYESLRNRYADLIATHSGTANKLELSQEEVNRVKKLYEEALQETSTAIRERNGLKQQCTAAIRQWDSALSELQEYKEALQKVQQQHEEAMKEINQAMAVRIKTNKDIKRLTEERDAALAEYSLIMSERDSVHRELEKLTDDLGQSKKQIKSLETQNKELSDKAAEAVQEAEVSKRRRDWAFSERDKIVRERESLRTLCDRLRRERDRAVSDLAEALSESEDIKKQKNLASKQLKELRERIETEKENRSMRFQYLSNSSSFSESRDSAIDSDMPSGHYSIKLPNVRGADHGLVLEPGVYISRIIPGSPAAKDSNINIGDRVLYINDTPIDNVQEAIIALSEDIDPIMLTLSRSAGHLPSPMNTVNQQRGINTVSMPKSSKNSAQMASSNSGGTHASTSSLKSDKSDPLSPHHSGSIVNQSTSSSRNRYGKTGLREILKVKLSSNRNKKLSSPEEAILATLDSAIDSGAAGSSNNNNNTYRKTRKKRSGRSGSGGGGLGSDNVNRNGTWPRVLANRANNSYTLPHNNGAHGNQLGIPEGNNRSHNSGGGDSSGGDPSMHHDRPDSSSFYGPYSLQSNTVCVRRKERPPISSLIWETLSRSPNPAKSLGAIASALPSGSKSNTARLSEGGNTVASAVIQPPHHRYSFGVFDPNSAGKMNKNVPERNSVVPMLTMSDGSSIDFSVKSGNTEILDYYVKRMGKNQNSSESDHLDKVVTPPSLALPNPSLVGTNNPSILRHSNPSPLSLGVPVTLDRYTSRFGTYANPRYSAHHHDNVGPIISMTTQGNPVVASSTLPLAIPKPNAFSFEPSSYHHTHSHRNSSEQPSSSSASMSITSSSGGPGNKVNLFRNSDDLLLHPSYPFELPGTFPRNREPQRIRIPSNQSVTSRSSTEKFDLRNSPMPLYHIEVTDPSNPAGPTDFSSWSRKPTSGEVRQVRIDKYDKVTEPLGIQISCKKNGGGVFVSSVTDNSLASNVGLQVGDQLLEVCGINMRSATYDLAANVLRQCGDSITMLVQYSPAKYHEGVFDDDGSSSDHDSNSHSDGESSSEHDDENNSSMSDNESHSSAHSGSPTPCNSPQSTLVRNSKKNSSIHAKNGSNVSSSGATGPGSASVQTVPTAQMMNKMVNMTIGGTASLKKGQPGAGMMSSGLPSEQGQGQQQSNTQQQQSQQNQFVGGGDKGQGESSLRSSVRENSSGMEKPRYLTLQLMKNSANLGICLVGGNVVGIYVHSVQHDSIANRVGLRTGDQILEYNGTDLRQATAEEAAFELAKPLDKVGILVQYNIQRYNEIKDQPGDGFYIRCLFDWPILAGDHQTGNPDQQQLSFRKDEILYVDNTMFNGKPGRWRAWKVDAEGHRRVWGVIPSKFKVEEDLMFKRSLGDMDSDRRTSTVTRRSFFRRKSHHRSSSRELASFSDFSINSYGDLSHGGLQLKDDPNLLVPSSYQRVERLEYMLFLRPVIILGALSDVIAERLVMDFPYQFGRVALEVMNCSGAMLEKGLVENIFVDYKRKGSHYECVTMGAIKEISAKKLYCILDVSTAGVERLQRAQMYPIVLLVKFKNAKQIREIKDLRCDKISVKAAKELYDHSLKVENEYKHLITTCVPGGTNISYMATQVKTAVEKEQSKTLWVPV